MKLMKNKKNICSKIFHDWYLYPKLQPILRRESRSERTGVRFPASPLEFSEIGYLLLPSRDMAERSLNRRQSPKQPTNQPTSRVSKSYVPFTCKFTMVMHFVPILHRRSRSKTNFYFFSYDKTSLKFCASFRFFLAVFTEKFQINPLSESYEKRNPIQARIQRGGGGSGPPPPRDLSEVWSCVEA